MAVARMGERWFWLLGLNPSVPSARFRWMASMGMRRIGFSILTCAVQPICHTRRTPMIAVLELEQSHHGLQRFLSDNKQALQSLGGRAGGAA